MPIMNCNRALFTGFKEEEALIGSWFGTIAKNSNVKLRDSLSRGINGQINEVAYAFNKGLVPSASWSSHQNRLYSLMLNRLK